MSAPLPSLCGITKRFVQRADLAGRIAYMMGGGGLRETVVQAVSGVDLDVTEGEVVGPVGKSAAARARLAASSPAS